jgi:hypothetical protein
VCAPLAKRLVDSVAIPPVRAATPSVNEVFGNSSTNATSPLGVPPPGASTLTLAVKKTLCPTPAAFRDAVSVAVVEAAPTDRASAPQAAEIIRVHLLKSMARAYDSPVTFRFTEENYVANFPA